MSQNKKILVTGASGQLGRAVLEELLKRGQRNLIGTTRNPEKLSELSNQGVEIRTADFKKAVNLVQSFQGATHLLLISTTDIGSRIEDQKNAVEAAKKAGVQHIMYTSWPNTEKSPALVAPDHTETEKAIRSSGLKYTFLRNHQYMENLMWSLPSAIESGTLYGCAGDGKAAYVARQDCANAAAGALIQADKLENAIFDISGPDAYSHAELVALVSEIKGKKLVYQDMSAKDLITASVKSGTPEMFAHLFASFDSAMKQGDVSQVTDAVRKLSGKNPQSLRDFLKANLK